MTLPPVLVTNYAAEVYVVLRRTDGFQLQLFDNWISLNYEVRRNAFGFITLVLNGHDPRIGDFKLDYWLEVWRAIPGASVDWYLEFYGLVRNIHDAIDTNGAATIEITAYGLLQLLAGRAIVGPKDSPRTKKEMDIATAIFQFVDENIGPNAFGVDFGGHVIDLRRVCPNLVCVEPAPVGILTGGDHSYQNLWDVVSSLADYAWLDLRIRRGGNPNPDLGELYTLTFDIGQFGIHRTWDYRQDNVPVIFGMLYGNLASADYRYERAAEENVIYGRATDPVSGAEFYEALGDYSLVDQSPYNRKEGSYDYGQETAAGVQKRLQAQLLAGRPKQILTVEIMQQAGTLYGKDYFVGDWVTVHYRSLLANAQVIAAKGTADGDSRRETMAIELGPLYAYPEQYPGEIP